VFNRIGLAKPTPRTFGCAGGHRSMMQRLPRAHPYPRRSPRLRPRPQPPRGFTLPRTCGWILSFTRSSDHNFYRAIGPTHHHHHGGPPSPFICHVQAPARTRRRGVCQPCEVHVRANQPRPAIQDHDPQHRKCVQGVLRGTVQGSGLCPTLPRGA
jgi:hypothetical protein